MTGSTATPPLFDEAFRASLRELIAWRRDVRRFKTDPVDPQLIVSLLDLAGHAPSVGHSQPWRFVLVDDPGRRAAVIAVRIPVETADVEEYMVGGHVDAAADVRFVRSN